MRQRRGCLTSCREACAAKIASRQGPTEAPRWAEKVASFFFLALLFRRTGGTQLFVFSFGELHHAAHFCSPRLQQISFTPWTTYGSMASSCDIIKLYYLKYRPIATTVHMNHKCCPEECDLVSPSAERCARRKRQVRHAAHTALHTVRFSSFPVQNVR